MDEHTCHVSDKMKLMKYSLFMSLNIELDHFVPCGGQFLLHCLLHSELVCSIADNSGLYINKLEVSEIKHNIGL